MATIGLVSPRLFMITCVVSFLFTSNPQVVKGLPVAASLIDTIAIEPKLSLDTNNQTTNAAGNKKLELANSLLSLDHIGISSSKSTITTEKLKRGLSNFMNQLDAAPFFVPANPHQTSNNYGKLSTYSSFSDKANAQKSLESPNSIKGGSMVLMKGTSRPMVQIWANGGPGRWGR